MRKDAIKFSCIKFDSVSHRTYCKLEIEFWRSKFKLIEYINMATEDVELDELWENRTKKLIQAFWGHPAFKQSQAGLADSCSEMLHTRGNNVTKAK